MNKYPEKFRIQRFSGPEARKYASDIARLRIEVFYEFPYLYEGSLSYEQHYLDLYFSNPKSAVVLCFLDDKVVGASTAIPLIFETATLKRPFVEAGLRLDDVFYYGESVLQKEFRGQGLGKVFFAEREAAAREQHAKIAAFSAVVRAADHALKPEGYKPLDAFWTAQGFEKQNDMVGSLSWKDRGESEDSPKSMQFWFKILD